MQTETKWGWLKNKHKLSLTCFQERTKFSEEKALSKKQHQESRLLSRRKCKITPDPAPELIDNLYVTNWILNLNTQFRISSIRNWVFINKIIINKTLPINEFKILFSVQRSVQKPLVRRNRIASMSSILSNILEPELSFKQLVPALFEFHLHLRWKCTAPGLRLLDPTLKALLKVILKSCWINNEF